MLQVNPSLTPNMAKQASLWESTPVVKSHSHCVSIVHPALADTVVVVWNH